MDIDYSTPFSVPAPEMPRDRWHATHARPEKPGWPEITVTVTGPDDACWTYDRNYGMLRTFEPFRQLGPDGVWREYALVAPNYSRTSVMDLATGEIIATEEVAEGAVGFCPAEFYVPDWWEPDKWGEQDGSLIPGGKGWDETDGARRGQYGFVAGCVWGDDHSWKIQVLDLSRITEGIVVRSAPFGYVELPPEVRLADAVTADWESGRVTLATPATFSMKTGQLCSWSLDGLNRPPVEN